MSPTNVKTVEFDQPNKETTMIKQAWARVPVIPSQVQRQQLKNRIKTLLEQKKAILVAHYYVNSDLQELAEETSGCVADSLEMARFGRDHPAQTLVVAGVRFMGETAKILSPEKRILMPDLDATCSLDLGCPVEDFSRFCAQHPRRIVVVYANTSVEVKARADWVVTSSIGLEIVTHLHQQGHKIIWGPDRHLGSYIQQKTGADMLLWQGACIVHNEFKGIELELLREQYPDAKVLVHPESPDAVVRQADIVGSTSQLISAMQQSEAKTFIVATDSGILYKMQAAAPDKQFIIAPTAGNSATCKSCANCPWMAMNDLQNVVDVLETEQNEITIDEVIRQKAVISIYRMLDFAAKHKRTTSASGDNIQKQHLFSGIGPA